VPDETLSSWINRHASFYNVPPLTMLQHCLPQAKSLLSLDRHLTEGQALAISQTFGTDPDKVRGMTLTDIPNSLHCMIAYHPIHTCRNCNHHDDPSPTVRRNQLFGWRITCATCGVSLGSSEPPDSPSPFQKYWQKALDAETFIQAEAMKESLPWTHLTDLA
jgi:TniQ